MAVMLATSFLTPRQARRAAFVVLGREIGWPGQPTSLADLDDTLTFTVPTGNPFPLQIGNTWVQLVPTWYADPVSFGE